jgi:hypothetical protein
MLVLLCFRFPRGRTVVPVWFAACLQQGIVLPQIHRRHLHPRRTRQRRRLPQQRSHRLRAQQDLGCQQFLQGFGHHRFSLLSGQMQDPQVFLVRSARLIRQQRVIRLPEDHRRIQVLPIHVPRERPRLPHQPRNDVAIIDAVLVLAAQPLHALHPLARIPDLDVVGTDPRLNDFAPQPGRHRVRVVPHPDRAATAHFHTLTLQRLQPPLWQSMQMLDFLRKLRSPAAIAPVHDLPNETPILLDAGKLPAAAQQQRLFHRFLETPMSLFAIPVLMRLGRVDGFRHDPIMAQQRPVFVRVDLRVPVLVHRQAHAVGPMPLGHAAQCPKRVLQSFGQTREALRRAQRHVLPVRVRQHKVVHQVRERLPGNRHAQEFHVREIRCAQAARLVHLGKEYFPSRTMLATPLPHAPLQRPTHGIPVPLGIFPLQPFPQRLGLQGRLALQPFLQPRPDAGQRIRPGSPGARLSGLARQLPQLSIFPGRFAIHTALQRCLIQRRSLVQPPLQLFHLGVGDQW